MKLPVTILAAAALLTACSTKSESKTDAADTDVCNAATYCATTDSVDVDAADIDIVAPFLNDLYNNHLFADGDFEQIKDSFSPEAMAKLRAAYDYDGEGYATWLLRSGEQDGPEDKSYVTEISADGDGWFSVSMTDMGTPATRRLRVAIINDEPIISDFE